MSKSFDKGLKKGSKITLNVLWGSGFVGTDVSQTYCSHLVISSSIADSGEKNIILYFSSNKNLHDDIAQKSTDILY